MKKALLPALGAVVLVVAVFYAWYYLPRGERASADELKAQALTAATPEERQAAAAQLSDWGTPAAPQMREVLQSTDLPAVKAIMVQALGNQFDYDSMDLLLAGLDDPALEVRQRSGHAVRTMLGRSTPYDADAPTAARAKAIALMRKDWEELKGSPLLTDFKERLQRGAVAPPTGPISNE
jgi:hypothetical protein